jgi:hypothetical protein
MPGATRRPAAGSQKPSTSDADVGTGDGRKKKAAAVLDMGGEE